MNEKKNIIIPLGFNAKQRKASLMWQLPSSFAYEWMGTSDFVQQYLYCMEDGPYDPPLEVWILYWPSPSEMVRKMHPTLKRGYSSADMALFGLQINLVWCKAHHAGMRVHLINILPPRFNSTLYDQPIAMRTSRALDVEHTIDLQEAMAHTDGDMPLTEFFETELDKRVAMMIMEEESTEKKE